MKNINLFGLKLMFEVKKDRKSDENIYSKEYALREKIIYLIVLMFVIAISAKFSLISGNNNYKVGDIIKSDIYAPHTVIFKDYWAKDKAIEEMIQKSGKEYIYSPDAKKVYIGYFDEFFDNIISMKDHKIESLDYTSIEKNTGRKISPHIVNELLGLKEYKIKKIEKTTRDFLIGAYENGIIQEKKRSFYKEPFDDKYKDLSVLEKNIVDTFSSPNYVYDEAKTKQNLAQKVNQIKDKYVEIKAGTLIGHTGEIIDNRRMKVLEACGVFSYQKSIAKFVANIIYLSIISALFYTMCFVSFKKQILNKNMYKATFLIILGMFVAIRFISIDFRYFIPLDIGFFLFVILGKKKSYAISMHSFALLFLMPILNYDLKFMAIYFIGMAYGGFIISRINTRSGLIGAGVKLAIVKTIIYLLLSFFSDVENFSVAINALFIMFSGILSGMLTVALLPYFEKTFNILTIFGLLELGDLSHPLLRKISLEAPGTFQHSMMVATLSENAAAAIKADAVFCRVASYYHDLGKTKRPKFYVENQENGINPHNNISPFMSNLIITSHTKDGAEMAKDYAIPKEIRDIMYEHQGTTLLAYFYNAAKKIDPTVRKDDFRYSGPKPRTKESAIIMLADSIEAGIRSLDEKTPLVMENMIRKIIAGKIEENQLSEASLTFKEIEIIVKTFVKTLMSIHHVRIKYPGQDDKKKKKI